MACTMVVRIIFRSWTSKDFLAAKWVSHVIPAALERVEDAISFNSAPSTAQPSGSWGENGYPGT